MKGIVYRSSALALACMVALSALAVPVSATDYQSTYNFWNWAYDNSWFLGKVIIGFSAGNVCQVSEDSLHHATTHSGGGGSVDGQRVYNCVCDLCGESFMAVATDLQQSYDVIINANDYTAINSSDYIALNLDWFSRCITNENYGTTNPVSDCSFFFNWPDWAIGAVGAMGGIYAEFSVEKPCYLITERFSSYCENGHSTSETFDNLFFYDGDVRTPAPGYTPLEPYELTPGVVYRIQVQVSVFCHDGVTVFLKGHNVWLDYSDDEEYISTPSVFAPYFSYEDENGTETVSDQQIIDEQGLNYYNPVTNTTTNITNWTYDYSDRSYTCITENNTTTTITYGDEFITINEGDNITYNIYYYTAPDSSGDGDNSGSGGSGSSDGNESIWDKIGKLFGDLLGGLVDLISGVISGLLDSLIDLVATTIEQLSNVVNLFGSLGDALKVLWSWLPDEVVTVLVSGVTVIIFASVIKLFVK